MGIESVEIAWALESLHGIRFPRLFLKDAQTVRELEDLVLRLRAQQLGPHEASWRSPADVREDVRQVIAAVRPIDRARVVPNARLMDDLGIDM